MVPRAVAIAGVLVGLLAGAAPPPPVRAGTDPATIARNLAENVLGRGLVRTSRVHAGGRGLTITWESATFKASNLPSHTRDLLQTEAQFAAESIFRVLGEIRDIDFEILTGRRSLCIGRASRDRPFRIAFAPGLGR
jgi:hypothetical protein